VGLRQFAKFDGSAERFNIRIKFTDGINSPFLAELKSTNIKYNPRIMPELCQRQEHGATIV
jgi:hypothetical protein